MSVEAGYLYDEPLGVYARKSHEQLARMVMCNFVRFETAQVDIDFVETLGDEHERAPMIDESRIGSLVESSDSYYGYGLVTPRLDVADEMGGIWYQVKRDGAEPAVVDTRHISFPHPAAIDSEQGKREVQKLMYELDKDQLESVLRMLHKMTTRLRAERPSSMREAEDPAGNWLRLIPEDPIEPDVLYAIKSHSLDHLRQLFPHKEKMDEVTDEANLPTGSQEKQHIGEWAPFITAANKLLREEADDDEAESYVNVQYEAGNKTYYIRLAGDHGELYGAQFLSVDHGGWATQSFDIYGDYDEDATGINIVSPTMWEGDAIINALMEGETIDDETYDGYRSMAAKALETYLKSKVIWLEDIKKRPAA